MVFGGSPILHFKSFDKITSKTRLIHVNVNLTTGAAPWEMDTDEPLDYTHEVDLYEAGSGMLELGFHFVTGGEEK